MALPTKKRKLSSDNESAVSSLPSIDVSPKVAAPPSLEASPHTNASSNELNTTAAAPALSTALDSKRHAPLKKRKASLDSSLEIDQALGLAPLTSTTSAEAGEAQQEKPSTDTTTKTNNNVALEHLDALGDDAGSSSLGSAAKEKDDSTLASSNQRVLLEALMSGGSSAGGSSQRRDRLESWGGMSDLSGIGERNTSAAAALALQYTAGALLDEDVVPSRISCKRDRKYSVASEVSDGGGYAEFLNAAMATVGDQLAELAGAVEMAAGASSDVSAAAEYKHDSDVSSTASPLIGPVSDFSGGNRSRSMSTSSKPLSVDYDAVAAAVDAAQAATGSLDLSAIVTMDPLLPPAASLPIAMELKPDVPTSSTTTDNKDMEAIRARARAAAGYTLPTEGADGTPAPRPPLKKRPKQPTPTKPPPPPPTPAVQPDAAVSSTPVISNTSTTRPPPLPPAIPSAATAAAAAAAVAPSAANTKATASLKWEEMYQALIQFKEERRQVELKDASQQERDEWVWDGNVPTHYKTSDGKKLGRWINNQRTAKSKGKLKLDREAKLVGTGLKFAVLAKNTWEDMMNELRLYVEEQGSDWDGNVPTNYRIKGEDKNLGRWVNRQRSMYHSGKLRQDRQEQLESIGLRWSILNNASWDEMFECLQQHVKDQKGTWDGNVPANFKKDGKALGRWINRQRSAYHKNKLKPELADQLTKIGLKWSLHDRSVPMSVAPAVATTSASADAATNSSSGVAPTPVVTSSSSGAVTSSSSEVEVAVI